MLGRWTGTAGREAVNLQSIEEEACVKCVRQIQWDGLSGCEAYDTESNEDCKIAEEVAGLQVASRNELRQN